MPYPPTAAGSHRKPELAVVLPGTGSDEVFARAVFASACADLGVPCQTPPPPPGAALVRGYRRMLDRLAAEAGGPVLVGGVSLGAHLAAEWAIRNADRCAGVLAVLPAWSGTPRHAPAAVGARASADLVDAHGLDTALALSTDGVPAWLAAELTRAWRRHGDGLAAGLRTASAHPAPTADELRRCSVPAGITACRDDPVHPVAVARSWARALPRARLRETTLAAFGADPASAGHAAVEAWHAAR